MDAPKPGLRNKFWAYLHKNDSFSDSCMELRLAAERGDLWCTDHLIDKLRASQHPHTELEIGYAMQRAASKGQSAVIELMYQKDCGLLPYNTPLFGEQAVTALFYKKDFGKFPRNGQERQEYDRYRSDPDRKAALEQLNWREISFLFAVSHDHPETAKMFMDKGVNVEVLDNNALGFATSKDYRKMTELLLQYGADPAANYYEAVHYGIYHDSSRMFGDSCLDPLLAQKITVPPDHMQALIAAALREDNFHRPTLEKVLNFALRQPEKADVKPLFDLPALQWNDVARNLLEEYQSLADKTKPRNPPRTRNPRV